MYATATVGEDHYSAGANVLAQETAAVSRALLGAVRQQQERTARNHGHQRHQQVEGV